MPEPLTGEALKKRLKELENAPRSEQLIACGYWSQGDDCEYSKANIKFCSELEKINALKKLPFSDIPYKEGEDYQEREGMWYWIDPEHEGHILVSSEMIEKYDLAKCPSLMELEDDEYEDWFEEEADKYKELYPCEIYINHCLGITPMGGKDNEITEETPHGLAYSEEFIAWWCEFPIELLKEQEKDVFIHGWCNG